MTDNSLIAVPGPRFAPGGIDEDEYGRRLPALDEGVRPARQGRRGMPQDHHVVALVGCAAGVLAGLRRARRAARTDVLRTVAAE
ncbi:hypothetical protein [Streptomyces sp. NPDC058632]|uniref:hypothetical protein n=1 Tax=unclassified Streptomyces TaxID=2593676 RepID=UPI003668B2FF